ncbi:hypothetical protein HRbin29_02352 [bacterium HR29]|nr:hypothetical protein HRbin29_02352 [bacterium HR29]
MATVEAVIPRPAAVPARWLAPVSFVLLNLVGLAAYVYPFLLADVQRPDADWYMHRGDGPILIAAVTALALALLVGELTNGGLDSKSLAALGVLAALAAVLRTFTLPAGANLYFFLVIMGAYVFGPRMGFLLGAFSFFLSALVTAGVGPWLPFQMFASAWMGLSVGIARPLVERLGLGMRGHYAALLALGFVWGLLYGAIINLWFWPFFVGGPDISYEPGLGFAETIRRYWNFYLLTSLGWDLFRSFANVAALAAAGWALLPALLRFHARFRWRLQPAE